MTTFCCNESGTFLEMYQNKMEEECFFFDILRIRNYLQVVAVYFYYRQLYLGAYKTCQQKTDNILFQKSLKINIPTIIINNTY